MLTYEGFLSPLRVYYKSGTGHALTAWVDVPWIPKEKQELPLRFSSTPVTFSHGERAVNITEVELAQFWLIVNEAHREIAQATDLKPNYPTAWLTGNLLKPTLPNKVLEMVGTHQNQHGLAFMVAEMRVSTADIFLFESDPALERILPRYKHYELARRLQDSLRGWIETHLFDGRRIA